MSTPLRTRAIFFDVDFTLIYPGPAFQGEGYRCFCAKHGIERCDPLAFHDAVASASSLLDESPDHSYDPMVFIRYIRHIIVRMGGTGEAALDACAEEIYREWAACHHFELYDDVVPALQALRGAGYQLGLISNTHRSLDAFRSHFELNELISAMVSSSEHGFNKPHPSIFRAALQLLDVEPSQAVMVGDSFRHDVLGALAVGMRAVLLRRGSAGAGIPDVREPDCGARGIPVIPSLIDLVDVLEASGRS